MRRQPARQRRRARGCTQPRAREHGWKCRRVRPPSGARCAPRGAGGHSRAPRTSASARASRAPWALSCESAHAAFPPPPPRRSARRTCAAPRVAARVRGVAHPPEAPASNIPNIAARLGPPQGAPAAPHPAALSSAAPRRGTRPGPRGGVGARGLQQRAPPHSPPPARSRWYTRPPAPPPWTAAANVHARARAQAEIAPPPPPPPGGHDGGSRVQGPQAHVQALAERASLRAARGGTLCAAAWRARRHRCDFAPPRPSAWPSGAWLLVRACGRAAD